MSWKVSSGFPSEMLYKLLAQDVTKSEGLNWEKEPWGRKSEHSTEVWDAFLRQLWGFIAEAIYN